jgi:gliding motility-associated lipoprotein GldH
MSACDPARVYEKNIDLPGKVWAVDQPLTFDFQIDEADVPYHLYYNVRHSRSYPYSRIFVTYYLGDTLGQISQSKLVYDQLFHPKSGRPLGESSVGDAYFNQFLFLENYTFAAPGTYRVTLEQFNRLDELPEVLSIGLRVEKAIKD